MKLYPLIIFITLFFSGCKLGKKYEVPPSSVPEKWKEKDETTTAKRSFENWWEIFDDKKLHELEKQVVDQNFDLFVALQKVIEARAAAGIKKADLFPQINLNPRYGNVLELIELYGIPTGIVPGLRSIVRVHETNYALPLTMSYEVDFWRKYRGQYDSALYKADAFHEAFRSTLLSITSELASHYYHLRTVDTELKLLEETISAQEKIVHYYERRYVAGLSTYIDFLQVEKEYKELQAEYSDLQRQRRLFENAIAILVGVPASDFHISPSSLAVSIPSVPVGLPSTILTKRPDVAQAEREMAAEHTLIGVALSNFFPSFTLTGGLGSSSPDLKNFLDWKSRLLKWGVDIVQSVIDGGRKLSKLEEAWARFRQAEGSYQQTVLTALQEVENALTSVAQTKEEASSLEESFEIASSIHALSYLRYEKGLVDLLEYLQSKIKKLRSERAWINRVGKEYQSTVELIKSIGGDWDETTEASDERKSLPQSESE